MFDIGFSIHNLEETFYEKRLDERRPDSSGPE